MAADIWTAACYHSFLNKVHFVEYMFVQDADVLMMLTPFTLRVRTLHLKPAENTGVGSGEIRRMLVGSSRSTPRLNEMCTTFPPTSRVE